ncbi:MAG: hypothetical protein ACRDUW_26480 [Pseudonocardiaceae bacterium]
MIPNKEDAARALATCFLVNADAGNNAANDELIAELLRHQRRLREQQITTFRPMWRLCMDITPGRWGVPVAPHDTLPSCSMVLTSGGPLVAKITSLEGVLYGKVTYVTDDGSPRYWGTWTHFLGQTWQRTLNLPSPLYEPLITARQPSTLVQRLGRIVRIDPATIVATMSAQDPVLLAEYAKVLDLLATWCGVDRSAFGIYGSAHSATAIQRRAFELSSAPIPLTLK